VHCASDIEESRELLAAAGSSAHIIAKIEPVEAIGEVASDGIITAADGIMVAGGDLGVEIGDANLVAVQKHLIETSNSANKVVITATQMMESMIKLPISTRAEVFDVANAVLDGTDGSDAVSRNRGARLSNRDCRGHDSNHRGRRAEPAGAALEAQDRRNLLTDR